MPLCIFSNYVTISLLLKCIINENDEKKYICLQWFDLLIVYYDFMLS